MKNQFEQPKIIVIETNKADVIATSGEMLNNWAGDFKEDW